jgi:thiol-disulfide isomerase/thioredoxin
LNRQIKSLSGISALCFIGGLIFCLNWFGCITIPNQHKGFPPGVWRGVLYIYEYKDLIVTEGRKEVVSRDVDYESKSKVIPFNFEIKYDSVNKPVMIIMNSSERIVFDDISIGRDIRTGDDTFRINLSPYDACLKGVFEEDKMRGYFVVQDKKDYYMAFEAKYGQDFRFNKISQGVAVNVNGLYQAVFADTSAEDKFDAIGEFTQQNNKVTGTFRTETGDFRYLQGEVDQNKLLLSCFDGSHAFLFEADIKGDSLIGSYYSGKHYKTNWRAVKVINGQLQDADTLTTIADKNESFRFKFYTPEQKLIDLDAPEYKNKVKIIQILGSWCPNCRDESTFLNEYLKEHSNPDLVVIGLSFERYPERQKAYERIRKYKSSLNISYEIAYGGLSKKDSASAALPQLSKIMAYPTMIFVDRNNKVAKIHTGFDGPATSQYQHFKDQFEKTIQELLKQK